MPRFVSTLDEPSDAELISAVRSGDVAAYGELFARHVEAARRLGRQLVPGPDVDDLVSEAFTKVLSVLQRGGGPDLAFRAYLLTAVRRVHVDRIRATARLHTTDDLTPFDPGVPFRDTAVEGFESAAAARAFGSLPERWQLVLWHVEVEGQKPAEVARLLGMTPNAVSALAYRAREGLRQAYLSMHAADASDDACQRTRAELGAYVRGGLSRRDAARVEQHLEECRRCTALYLELTEVNSNLRGLIAPLVLGVAATAYVAPASGAAPGVGLLLGRLRDAVLAHGPTAAAASAAAAAVVAGAVMMLHQDRGPDPGADTAPSISTAPPTAAPAAPSTAPSSRPDPPARRVARGEHRGGPLAASAPHSAGDSAPDGRLPSTPAERPTDQPSSSSPTRPPEPTPDQPEEAGQPPAGEPSSPPASEAPAEPATPPLVDLDAGVTAGPGGVGVGLGLGLGGATVLPHTTVGVPLPPVG